MKLPKTFFAATCRRARARGFTLPEILIAMTILILVVTGILAAHVFGLKMLQTNQTKLTATEWSRNNFGKLTGEIHSCYQVQVGTITNGAFAGLLDGEAQQGNSLIIYPTSDTNHFIVYFLNHPDQTLRRTTELPGTAMVLAENVTNNIAFSAHDLSGNFLTNNLNNRVIHVMLEFFQPALFLQSAQYYKLETSVARRALQ
jgi:prepilin-type N-terminal cleavage/methylation domain-containing protein